MNKVFMAGLLVCMVIVARPAPAAESTLDSAREVATDMARSARSAATDAVDYMDDAAVTASVKARFLAERGLNSLSIRVRTDGGVVILSGTVDHPAQIALAGRVAMEVDGVRRVENKLAVKDGVSTLDTIGSYLDDTAVTASVKTAILTQKGLNSLDIRVETQNGVVRLDGRVDHAAQSALAERVTEDVKGVRKVENRLHVR